MDKIQVLGFVLIERIIGTKWFDKVPTHVRDGFFGVREVHDWRWNNPESKALWRLGGRLEEDLKTDAYPEIRLSRLNVITKGFKETSGSQSGYSSLESAYTRKNQTLDGL